jgi:hypothetical protein
MRQALVINATMPIGLCHEVDTTVPMLFVVGVLDASIHSRKAVSDLKPFEGHSGQYLTVRNNDSE